MSSDHNEIDPAKFEYHEEEARALVGKLVVVGVTHRTASGVTTARRQFAGVVEHVSRRGIALRLTTSGPDDPTMWLPPAPRCFEPAAPGTYRLRSTGETIEDPDFTTTWFYTASEPDSHASSDG
jgi:hypothetical protein